MYHGLLCDTFFRGHFTASKTVDVLDKRIPTGGLESDPDPVEVFLKKFGYNHDASLELVDRTSFDVDPDAFVRAAIADEFDSRRSRADQIQNALSCCGIANQPSIPFHNHLSDHFVTSFLATDRELIDWHLRTPPEHRTTETFLRACERVDSDILRHRPPTDRTMRRYSTRSKGSFAGRHRFSRHSNHPGRTGRRSSNATTSIGGYWATLSTSTTYYQPDTNSGSLISTGGSSASRSYGSNCSRGSDHRLR